MAALASIPSGSTVLESNGEIIGNNDLAAHALAAGSRLVANNAAEFRRAEGAELDRVRIAGSWAPWFTIYCF
jgi:hypothetical protein